MKKIKKLFKKLNNSGSSVVMVIVSIAFIGIIVSALLSAAMYSYKLKIQNKNSKDNFYYVEQAMQEIYAGVGSQTVNEMKEAYATTIENMITYDTEVGMYQSLSNKEANEMFKKEFMRRIKDNPYFKQGDELLAESLAGYISNSTVTMDKGKLKLDITTDEIAIRNITLTREQEYGNGVQGTYKQTISADIIIGTPDFSVVFNNTNSDYSNIFDYALIADMGVEITQDSLYPLTIAGNIYAAADFYNKKYNEGDQDAKTFEWSYTTTVDGANVTVPYKYKHGNVTSKYYTSEILNDYYNNGGDFEHANEIEIKDRLYFDGVNQKSANSGLYIEGSTVEILANQIIVPGTVAVMDNASLTVYGKKGTVGTETEIWTDNIVLGGYGIDKSPVTFAEGTNSNPVIKKTGPQAILRANVFVKDDTEINAAGANFTLNGNYFGFGNSTDADTRTYVPTVDTSIFTVTYKDADNKDVTEARGHYNSSSIIVNGSNSYLDLSKVKELFLAGRTYIELSKDVKHSNEKVDENGNILGDDATDAQLAAATDVYTETYSYQPTYEYADGTEFKTEYIRDYKTGESVSMITNQLAYIPASKTGVPTTIDLSVGTDEYKGLTVMELAEYAAGNVSSPENIGFFEDFFPYMIFMDYVPCTITYIGSEKPVSATQPAPGLKEYYYYDFHTAYEIITNAKDNGSSVSMIKASNIIAEYPTEDAYVAGFIKAYSDAVEYDRAAELDDTIVSVFNGKLVPLDDYEDFNQGYIVTPKTGATVYSSGAITTRNNTTFSMSLNTDKDTASALLSDNAYNNTFDVTTGALRIDDSGNVIHGTPIDVFRYFSDINMEYNYMRWNLGHFKNNDNEKAYVKQLVDTTDFGAEAISPINRYFIFDNIKDDVEINPTSCSLACGVKVWISSGNVTVTGADEKGVLQGIVIAKGDVTFADDVKSFEGLIVAGGKIYINSEITTISSSPSSCRAVLKECQTDASATYSEYILSIFKEYAPKSDDEGEDPDNPDVPTDETRDISQIDYSDVCSFENWMKTAE